MSTQITLTRVTKKVYTEQSRSDDVVAKRPDAFIVKVYDVHTNDMDHSYRIYMEHDNMCYCGALIVDTPPTKEFLDSAIVEFETVVSATFEVEDDNEQAA